MKFAMNSTMMKGTPRTISMKPVQIAFTIGSFDLRPSASNTPSGSENTMPTSDTSSVTRTPPHRSVVTTGRPSQSDPRSSTKDRIGKATKNSSAATLRFGAPCHSSHTMSPAPTTSTRSTRQCWLSG